MEATTEVVRATEAALDELRPVDEVLEILDEATL